MSIQDALARGDWDFNPPATVAEIARLTDWLGLSLNDEFAALLAVSNGGAGSFSGVRSFIRFWRIENIIAHEGSYEIRDLYPGRFAFGDAGGCDFFAFDTRHDSWPVLAYPWVGGENDVVCVADSLNTLLDRLHPRNVSTSNSEASS